MADIHSEPIPEPTEKEINRFWPKIYVKGPEDCWLWKGRTRNGYGQFALYRNNRTIRVQAHRFAYLIGHGKDPAPLYALHRCDERRCCNPLHIFLGNSTDNIHDCMAKGRMQTGDSHYMRRHPEMAQHGEKAWSSRLKESDVIEIRALHATGKWFHREIAAKFGIRPQDVCRIVNRQRWKYLPSPEVLNPPKQRKPLGGEDHPFAKLRDDDVRDIRALHATGSVTQREIARRYEVGPSVICNIVNRKRWGHVA